MFARRAEEVKTPKKIPLKIDKVKAFKTIFDREKVKRKVKLQPGGFSELSLDYFEEIADQFQRVKGVLNQAMLNSNSNLDQVLSTLKMIEFEKNKIKVELGNRENALINENFDTSSVWEIVGLISKHVLREYLKGESKEISNYLKSLERENNILRGDLKSAEQRLIKIEETHNREFSMIGHRLNALQFEVDEVSKLKSWKEELKEVRKEMTQSNPSKKTRLV